MSGTAPISANCCVFNTVTRMVNIANPRPKDKRLARCVLLILSLELSNAQDMLHLGHHFEGRQRYV